MLFRSRYVIFDEPSASLTPHETDRVLQQINVLCQHNAGVIYISHRLEEVTKVSSQVICLRDGHVAKTWSQGNVPQEDLVRAMVGREFRFEHHAPVSAGTETVLEVKNLAREGVFEEINFSVSKGEVFGIAGLVGAGRTELVRAIAGVDNAVAIIFLSLLGQFVDIYGLYPKRHLDLVYLWSCHGS